MNNEQFRRLLASDGTKSQNGTNASNNRHGAATASLGAQARSNISMTPRNVKISAKANTDHPNEPPLFKPRFRSSAAPKGTKLAAGYHDRTKDRVQGDDDLTRRVNALEEQVKLGLIDRTVFEKLRDEITGGDVSATHLVKGLDRKLLERVRRGENVMEATASATATASARSSDEDDELDKIADSEVTAIRREKVVKKGEMASQPPVAGVKRNRAAILAELKASRKATAEAAASSEPQLSSKFRKIGHADEPRIEFDDEGREILLVKGPDGKLKRKVRKTQSTSKDTLLAVDKNATPLGIEQELLPKSVLPTPFEHGQNDDDIDDDIFDGVGTDYDPLADLGEESDATTDDKDQSSTGKDLAGRDWHKVHHVPTTSSPPSKEPVARAEHRTGTRNYFNEPLQSESILKTPINPMNDPTVLAAIKNASRKADRDESDQAKHGNGTEDDKIRKRAAMLSTTDRDLEDMDMGFGSSRFDDAEDAGDGNRIRLSEWKGGRADDEDIDKKDRGGKQRKRGPKKKKGDKNSAADVISVIERRKG